VNSTPTTIQDLAEALEESRGVTPQEIVDAFIHAKTDIAGTPLVPLSAGHDLFLTRIKHPLTLGASAVWGAHDVATAFFVFSRTSRELNQMVADGTYEEKFYNFLDSIPMSEINAASAGLIAHWVKCRNTALPMKAPDGQGELKKKADLVGGSK
jgi:hypothetical protein